MHKTTGSEQHRQTKIALSQRFVLLLLGCLIFGVTQMPTNTFAEDITVEVGGKASWTAAKQAQAQKEALQAALRAAVEQGVGLIIDSQTLQKNFQIVNDRIYSAASGLVKKYDILSEGPLAEEDAYEVKIRAVVSRVDLETKLNSIAELRVQQMVRGQKSLIVLYDPRASGATLPLKFTDPNEQEVILAAIGELNRVFLNAQFNTFDADRLAQVNKELNESSDLAHFDQRALKLAQSNSADILITFRLMSFVTKDQTLSWSMSEMEVKAVFAGNGQLIGSSRTKGKVGFKTGASGGEVFTNMASSAMQASKPAGNEIVKQILVTSPPKEVLRFLFSNLSILQKRAIPKSLRDLPGYKSHRITSEKTNAIDIDIELDHVDAGSLSTQVSELLEKDASFKGMLVNAECDRNRCSFSPVKGE